jgi:hypothetical protein
MNVEVVRLRMRVIPDVPASESRSCLRVGFPSPCRGGMPWPLPEDDCSGYRISRVYHFPRRDSAAPRILCVHNAAAHLIILTIGDSLLRWGSQ